MADPSVGNVSAQVRRQYEQFPYPARDASDGVRYTPLDDLDVINNHCFAGKRDFRDSFRVLVAGGGTGDATIFYAHQLRETNARIVHLDFSQPAIDVARGRLHRLGLDRNVEWYCGSLTALPAVAIPKFDLINCVGVLHHLPDPQAGLRALCAVLKDDGALALMLYGKYGRTA